MPVWRVEISHVPILRRGSSRYSMTAQRLESVPFMDKSLHGLPNPGCSALNHATLNGLSKLYILVHMHTDIDI